MSKSLQIFLLVSIASISIASAAGIVATLGGYMTSAAGWVNSFPLSWVLPFIPTVGPMLVGAAPLLTALGGFLSTFGGFLPF